MSLTKIGSIGINTGIQLAGVTTVATLHVGSGVTLSSDGDVFATGISTFSEDIKVGSGVTVSPDGNIFATGVTTTGSLVSSGAISGTTGTFSGAVSGTTGTFTGDVSIPDTIVHTGDTNTKIRFPAADTITAETGGSERVRIDSSGNFGVGTNNPTTKVHIQQSAVTSAPSRSSALYLENNANCEIQFVGNSSNDCQLRFGTSSNSFKGAIEYELDNNNLIHYTNGNEKLRITEDGQVELRKNQDGVTGRPTNRIVFKDTDTSVAANQPIGEISWYSTDSGMVNVNSYIRGINEATNGSGALTFGVKAAGSSETEALRIDSSGRILIAAGAVATPKASVGGLDVSSGIYSIIMGGETNVGDGTGRRDGYQKESRLGMPHFTVAEEPFGLIYGVTISGENRLIFGGGSSILNAATSITFHTAANTTTTAGTERLRIDSSGRSLFSGTLGYANIPLSGNPANAAIQIRTTSKYNGIAFGEGAVSGAIGLGGDDSTTAMVFVANAHPANLGGGAPDTFEWHSGTSGGGGPAKIMTLDTSGNMSLSGNGNVSSVSDLGTGSGRVTFSNAMPDTTYCVVSGLRRQGTHDMLNVNFSNSTGNFRYDSFSNASSSNADLQGYAFAVFR